MESFRARRVIDRPSLALVVIESLSSLSRRSSRGFGFSGTLEPVALVIRDSAGLRAVDLEGHIVDLVALSRKVPALGSELESIRTEPSTRR